MVVAPKGGSMAQLADRLRSILFEDRPDWFGAKVRGLLLEHPTIGLTLLYIFASGIGLLFEFLLYLRFGVNILDYSETSDFVWSALKRPQPAVASVLAIVALVCLRLLSKRVVGLGWRPLRISLLIITWPWLLRKEILFALLALVLLSMYSGGAHFKAHDKTFFEDTIVTVTTRSSKPEMIEMVPIGSVGSFLFGIRYTTALREARSSENSGSVDVDVLAVHASNVATIQYSQVAVTKIPNRDETLSRLEDLIGLPLR